MTIILGDKDVRAATDMGVLVAAIENVLSEEHRGRVICPPRVNTGSAEAFLRLMPASLLDSGILGYKTFHGSMARGVRYLIVLCQESDGQILAIMDAAYLTAARTGATSGVATRYLARPGSAIVAVIGSGLEAETNLEAIGRVRDVSSVKVFSPNVERRRAFANRAAEHLMVEIQPVDTPEEAVRGADIVLAATNSGANGPVALQGRWLEEGQHVVSIGSTTPALHESDPETFRRADIIVFDAGQCQVYEESGDLIAARKALDDSEMSVPIGLAHVVGHKKISRPDHAITLFKSVGTAAQDIAAAKAIYDLAVERGLGNDVGDFAGPKVFEAAIQPTSKSACATA